MGKEAAALQLIKEQKFEEAAKILIELMETYPKEPKHYMQFGQLLFQMKQYEEAERFLLKAIELDESIAASFYSLGNLYYETALYDDAEKIFHHALKLGLRDSDAHFMLGMTYVQKDKITLSLPYLQRSAELSDEVDKHFQYGLSLAKLNYIEEAKRVFEKVIALDEHHADGLYNLGIIAMHEQDFAKATDYIEKTLQLQENHTLALQAKETMEKLSEK